MNIKHSGQSLVEVLVGAGIMSIVIMGLMSMLTSQQKETKALTEKLASLDLEKLLIASLADGTICTAELTNSATNPSAPYSIDTTNAAAAINLTSLHSSAAAGAPVLVSNGTTASALSSSLVVSGITVSNFINTGVPDRYLANIQVKYKPGQLVRPLKPIVIKVNISTDPTTPLNAKKIVSCSADSGGSSGKVITPLYLYCLSCPPPNCPAGWTQVDIQGTSLGNTRTCLPPADQTCSTLYLEGNGAPPANCPAGWTQGSYANRGPDLNRSCFKCSTP
ncbi:MAG: type IV pilus modification PilV family protein [Pseudobdellovibrionaceae bacterium]